MRTAPVSTPKGQQLGIDGPGDTASQLEKRAYAIIVAAGGRAVAQPSSSPLSKYRPDLLGWLGHLDAELLDPTVIDVKLRVSPGDMLRIRSGYWCS